MLFRSPTSIVRISRSRSATVAPSHHSSLAARSALDPLAERGQAGRQPAGQAEANRAAPVLAQRVEVAVGLGIVLNMYRLKGNVELDTFRFLRG